MHQDMLLIGLGLRKNVSFIYCLSKIVNNIFFRKKKFSIFYYTYTQTNTPSYIHICIYIYPLYLKKYAVFSKVKNLKKVSEAHDVRIQHTLLDEFVTHLLI